MKRTKSVRAGAGKTTGVPWTAACVAAFAARASLSFLSWLLRADSGMSLGKEEKWRTRTRLAARPGSIDAARRRRQSYEATFRPSGFFPSAPAVVLSPSYRV